MRMIRPSNEAEMIAEFLRQEWNSQVRYGNTLGAALTATGATPDLLVDPGLDDPVANEHRRRVFAAYRGYGTGEPSYLTDFPDSGVRWSWASISPDEVLACRYIRYDYWTELSSGSRSPVVAARRIGAGRTAFDVANDGFLSLAAHLQSGATVPPLILVRATPTDTPVVLEGHARITAYALVPDLIPPELTVLVGESPHIANWDEY